MKETIEVVDLTWEMVEGWTAGHIMDYHERNPLGTVRSSGIHQSTLIRSIALRTGILGKQKETIGLGRKGVDPDEEKKPPNPLVCSVGVAWEQFVAGLYPDVIWQPGEAEVDGVYMTADGLTPCAFQVDEKHEGIGGDQIWSGSIFEAKATWKSCEREGMTRSIRTLWMWWVQVMGYCWTWRCLEAEVHTLFLMGNWKFEGEGPAPRYVVYRLRFEPVELRENWRMVMREKERIGGEDHE